MKRKRILIAGAGTAGQMAVQQIRLHAESGFDPVAFLDDGSALQGTVVAGLPVLGKLDALVEVVRDNQIDEVLIAIPTARGPLIRQLITLCGRSRIASRIVPGLMEIIKGDVHFEQIRPVAPEDLLGREVVELEHDRVREVLNGRRILVTGAGGSIGQELCRQIAPFAPAELQILGRGENSIFEIDRELQDLFPRQTVRTVIADIRDEKRLQRLAATLRPEVIFHAAAHKHVPYMESFPSEAVLNNIWGTLQVVRMAQTAHSQRLVFISTDKAVRPRSVMGASKRFAEHMLQAMQAEMPDTRLMAVRFGNVLASRGSVVPLFQAQLRRGVPLTVTHPDVTRYFMTIREACLLVLQASALGKGGEVFILKMGEAVRILDLARNLIALSGFDPEQVRIDFTGLRPGEKLHEELHADSDEAIASEHPRIDMARLGEWSVPDAVQEALALAQCAREGDERGVSERLQQILPDFAPESGTADS